MKPHKPDRTVDADLELAVTIVSEVKGRERRFAASFVQQWSENALNGARKRDSAYAKQLCDWIVHGLRKHRTLPAGWAEFLADAVEAVVEKPEQKAGVAFGVVPPRGAPANSDERIVRDMKIARRVEALKNAGHPLTVARKGIKTAHEIVASEFRVSEKTVRRAWSLHLQMQRMLDKK